MGFMRRKMRNSNLDVAEVEGYWITLLDRLLPSSAGIRVSEKVALNSSAVFACVRLISETMASLPLKLYKRQGKGRMVAENHPLHYMMNVEPNPEMRPSQFKEVLATHVELWGNAYCDIQLDNSDRPKYLWILRPDRMEVKRDGPNNTLQYIYQMPNGKRMRMSAERILHIPGWGYDGVKGLSSIDAAMRDAVGLALSLEQYGAKFFKNDARPSVVLKHPQTLDDEAHDRLMESWDDVHKGAQNAYRAAILEEGMDIETIGVPPEAAQFVASRRFQLEEIARIFRVPPHMIQDLSRSTFSNIEHQGIDFVQHTMRPRLIRFEQGFGYRLLNEDERGTYYFEFLVDALLRGDIATRYAAYVQALNNGFMNHDEVRSLENLNALPEGIGQTYFMPMNVIPIEEMLTPEPEPEPEPDDDEPDDEPDDDEDDSRSIIIRAVAPNKVIAQRRRLRRTYTRLLEREAGRMTAREITELNKLIKRAGNESPEWFMREVKEFYDGFRGTIERLMEPVFDSYAESVNVAAQAEISLEQDAELDIGRRVKEYSVGFVNRHVSSAIGQMRGLEKQSEDLGDFLTAAEERVAEWEEKNAEKIGRREGTRAGEAFALFTFAAAGVASLIWVANDGACPFCEEMDGSKVGVEEPFVRKGETLNPDEPNSGMRITGPKLHPPLHDGCECSIMAG